jgi:phosphoadenosine phosphosulfate reductase
MGLQLAALPAPAEFEALAQRLEGQSADEIVRWAVTTYGTGLVLACSFGGPTGMVALDLVMAAAPGTPVFYLDTGFLFPETYALVETVSRHYGITPIAVRPALSPEAQAAKHGEALWQQDADACCAIRKVAPQRDFLRPYQAWITGLRRDQAGTRRATPVVSWDRQFGLAKIAPLATWTEDEVWAYIYRHNLPYNPLHDLWYPSLGCVHCTRAILPGEDLRAGRWSGTGKIECGLHRRPDQERALAS